jgi:hypothetical protein
MRCTLQLEILAKMTTILFATCPKPPLSKAVERGISNSKISETSTFKI